MKRLVKNNKGYSLIEMIIVLAIVALMSTLAGVTITMLNSAKAKNSAVTFDSEVATLITKAKNMECSYDANDDGVDELHPEYVHCLKVHKVDDTYYLAKGYYDTVTKKYIFDEKTELLNGGNGISLSSKVNITYTKTGGSEADIDDTHPCYITFTKTGLCSSGDGTYIFYKKNGNLVAQDTVRKNGSHQTK